MKQITLKTIGRRILLLVLLFGLQGPGPASRPRSSVPDNLDFSNQETLLERSPCARALAQRAVCVAANQRALELMNAGEFEAFTIMQDVRTGSLIAFAASHPAKLDVTTPVLPLSVIKLLLAASWWDNQQPDSTFDSYRGATDTRRLSQRLITVHEMLVGGSDNVGRQMAIALRKAIGTETIRADLNRYLFGRTNNATAKDFGWGAVSPSWRARLKPGRSSVLLNKTTTDGEWAEALSLGEKNIKVTGLHISRFLQAVGNDGVMLPPTAREQRAPAGQPQRSAPREKDRAVALSSIPVMSDDTTRRLQAGMRGAVQRGTARSVAGLLAETGWQLGGKTGTGPGPAPIGPQSDGWFAGLVFDPHGNARFTVATFVRHGGPGGGNAARISAELARFIIGKTSRGEIRERVAAAGKAP